MEGPVARSLDASLRRAFALAGVVWQLVMIWVVLAGDPTQPRGRLVVAHIVAAVVVLALLSGRRFLALVAVVYYLLLFYDYYAAASVNGPLCLAACWLGNCTHTAAALLARS